jgi:hypothetical protein
VGLLRVAAGFVALALLVAGCTNPSADPVKTAAHGTEFPASTPHIVVKHGDKFSVVVSETGSDRWKLQEGPDPQVAKTDPEDATGGKRFFVFTATAAGESSITLYDAPRSTGYAIHLQVV